MNDNIQSIFVLTSIVFVSAIAWHLFVEKYFLSVAGATLTTAIAFQLANYYYIGYLDPFFIIAILASGCVAFVGSAIIGLPFKIVRDRLAGKSKRKA